jgi:uncharacterized OB-fold protein
MSRVLPRTDDPLFAEYWSGTRAGVIRVQRCGDCGRRRWPVRPICPSCFSEQIAWEEISADDATLHTWTVVWHRTLPEPDPPYTVGIVEVAGVRMLGNIVDCDPAQLVVGMALRPVFESVTPEVTLVQWTPQ